MELSFLGLQSNHHRRHCEEERRSNLSRDEFVIARNEAISVQRMDCFAPRNNE
ncbi:MAG: hypothetical protein LBR81_03855 [Prevotellaceae bacterium]|jgi:hypothetical protein|nr:hypothetical protein [Prevotellaceae bacterium]